MRGLETFFIPLMCRCDFRIKFPGTISAKKLKILQVPKSVKFPPKITLNMGLDDFMDLNM
jgi:hypothetical protein